jgi:vacuolar-type H+-ATPase subunit H
MVDKETIRTMLNDLSTNLPEEINLYRRVINERDKILSDAQKKAQSLVEETTVQKNQMINEQSVMQEAYQQANEVVKLASQHAQEIEDSAVSDANNYRLAAVQYMDTLLEQLQQTVSQAQTSCSETFGQYSSQLQALMNTMQNNRAQLHPELQAGRAQQAKAAGTAAVSQEFGQTAQINASESGVPESATATIPLGDLKSGESLTGSLTLDGLADK